MPACRLMLHAVSRPLNVDGLHQIGRRLGVTEVIAVGRRKLTSALDEDQGNASDDAVSRSLTGAVVPGKKSSTVAGCHVSYYYYLHQAVEEKIDHKLHILVGIEITSDAVKASESAKYLREKFPDAQTVTFLPGNEGEGLSLHEQQHCDAFVYIPQRCDSRVSPACRRRLESVGQHSLRKQPKKGAAHERLNSSELIRSRAQSDDQEGGNTEGHIEKDLGQGSSSCVAHGGAGSLNVLCATSIALQQFYASNTCRNSLAMSDVSSGNAPARNAFPSDILSAADPAVRVFALLHNVSDEKHLHHLVRTATSLGVSFVGCIGEPRPVLGLHKHHSKHGRTSNREQMCPMVWFSSVAQATREIMIEFAADEACGAKHNNASEQNVSDLGEAGGVGSLFTEHESSYVSWSSCADESCVKSEISCRDDAARFRVVGVEWSTSQRSPSHMPYKPQTSADPFLMTTPEQKEEEKKKQRPVFLLFSGPEGYLSAEARRTCHEVMLIENDYQAYAELEAAAARTTEVTDASPPKFPFPAFFAVGLHQYLQVHVGVGEGRRTANKFEV